jgi:hypothetical protein
MKRTKSLASLVVAALVAVLGDGAISAPDPGLKHGFGSYWTAGRSLLFHSGTTGCIVISCTTSRS